MERIFFLNNVNTTLGLFFSKNAFLVLIIGYIGLGYSVDAELIFYTLSLFSQINSQFGLSLPLYFSRTVQLSASLQRLDKVMQADEMRQGQEKCFGSEKPSIKLINVSINLMNKNALEQISLNISNPGLHIVTGPVGSGKTSLLKVILKEYDPVAEGKIFIQYF